MKLLRSYSLYMSNLFPSPCAFDFPQVFYHFKAAGLVYFIGVREGGIGGEGRTASVFSQRGMPEKRQEGGEGCSSFSPWCAMRQGNRTGLCPTPEVSKLPPSSAPAPQPWAHSGIMRLKESEKSKLHLLPCPQESHSPLASPSPRLC